MKNPEKKLIAAIKRAVKNKHAVMLITIEPEHGQECSCGDEDCQSQVKIGIIEGNMGVVEKASILDTLADNNPEAVKLLMAGKMQEMFGGDNEDDNERLN